MSSIRDELRADDMVLGIWAAIALLGAAASALIQQTCHGLSQKPSGY